MQDKCPTQVISAEYSRASRMVSLSSEIHLTKVSVDCVSFSSAITPLITCPLVAFK